MKNTFTLTDEEKASGLSLPRRVITWWYALNGKQRVALELKYDIRPIMNDAQVWEVYQKEHPGQLQPTVTKGLLKQDLTYGEDVRGDHALFIEESHIIGDQLDAEAHAFTENLAPTFFRVLNNGQQRGGHGWIEKGEIIQWG